VEDDHVVVEEIELEALDERNDPVDADVDGEDAEREHEHRVVRLMRVRL
jgi:hypothetical protein